MPALVYTQHHDTSSFCLVERSCGGLGALESVSVDSRINVLRAERHSCPLCSRRLSPGTAVAASGVLHGCPLNPEP